jgi:hypothetical protein
MRAITRDFDLTLRVFAALATVRFALCYGTPASRMGAFVLFSGCHKLSFLNRSSMGITDLNYGSASVHQVEYQDDQRHHQEQVDQAPPDAHGKSQKPENQ